MNPGLVYLLRKLPAARWRKLRRSLHTLKGALIFAAGVLLTAVVVLSQVLVAMLPTPNTGTSSPPAAVRTWALSGLFLLTLMNLSSPRGIYFRLPEVNFLFPAPVGRRELLLYHVYSRLGVLLLSALWMSLFVARYAVHWWAGAFALYLQVVFLYLVGQLSGLVFAAVDVRLQQRIRRTLRFLVLGLLAFGSIYASAQLTREGTGLRERLAALQATSTGRILTLPLRPLVEVFVADSAYAFMKWSTASVALLAILLAGTLAMDVAYTEGAVEASRRIHEQLSRMRRGQPVRRRSRSGHVHFHVPQPPFWQGVGPIAWWHGTQIVRNLRPIATFLLVFSGFVFIPSLVIRGTPQANDAAVVGITGASMALLMTRQMFRIDCGDANRIAQLKSLPLSSRAIAGGHILVSVAFYVALQLVLGGALVATTASAALRADVLLVVLPALVPFNWMLSSLDQVLFFLLPYQPHAASGADLQFGARNMFGIAIQMLATIVVTVLSVLVGVGAWFATGKSLLAAGIATAGLMSVTSVLMTLLAGRLFVSFDVARDLPE
jgi:hypothetical protein